MAKRDYNKISQTKADVKENPAEDKVIKTSEEIPKVEDQVTESQEETKTEEIFGIVSGCRRLNIRKKPKKDADVVLVVDANTKLIIDETTSTDDWYSVCTSDGINGFCMREFVKVKS